jgi:hypothetical protein
MFLIYLILTAALSPWIHSGSSRNERGRKMFLGSRARPVSKADNLTGICKPTVGDPQHITTHHSITDFALHKLLVPNFVNLFTEFFCFES